MALALIVGYLTVRSERSQSARQTLLTSVDRTSEGLRLSSKDHLEDATSLATEEVVVDVLTRHASGEHGSIEKDFQSHLAAFSRGSVEDGPLHTAIYNSDGVPVVGTEQEPRPLPDAWSPELGQAQFLKYGYSWSAHRYEGTVVAPIFSSAGNEKLGYLSIVVGLDSHLRYAAGMDDEESGPHDFHQFIYDISPQKLFTVYFESVDHDFRIPNPIVFGTDVRFGEAIREEGGNSFGTLALDASGINGASDPERSAGDDVSAVEVPELEVVSEDVILAYRKIPEMGSEELTVYLVAGRLTSQLYGGLNRGAGLALLTCVLFIAFLCVNAYRDVHNNIVRPVSLLNEGAQIVRQGDFDLKLKIGTGDEIEELASSFNSMALALKRNIHQLEESEESYRSLVTSMLDGVYQADLKGGITFLNPAGVEIIGFPSADEALGKDVRALLQHDVVPGEPSEILESDMPGERSRLWMRRWDGRNICVEVSHNHVLDDEGNLVGVEGIFRDVTKSVRLEGESAERSERISAINHIANAINSSLEAGRLYESLVGEMKKLLDFDYAAVALLNELGAAFDGRQLWPDRELRPGHTFVLDKETSCSAWVAREARCLVVDDVGAESCPFAPQFPEEVQSCLCVPLYATGRIIGTLNLGNYAPDAYSVHDVEVIEQMAPHLAVAIRNAQMLVNLQLSLEEVTRGRQKLHDANEELKTLDELKTNLLSNVSHELRTPLVSVMGYTDMILNGMVGPINNTQRDYLGISLRNVEKLVTLIENLLDFSRLHRGDERMIFDTFDLVDCACTSIQVVQPVSDSREIEIELLAPDGPVLVEGDKGKIGQVFNNLLSNAVKFIANGGTVTVEMRLGDGWVEVAVSDTGIGIHSSAARLISTASSG